MTLRLEYLYKIDIEKTVLSSFIFSNDEFHRTEFTASMFSENRIIIFNGIKELINKGFEADFATITTLLAGKVKVSELSDILDAPISGNISYHYRELENARLRREMYTAYTASSEMCLNGLEPSVIALNVKQKITNIEVFDPVTSFELANTTLDEITRESREGEIFGIKTGIKKLDRIMNGFQPGEFVVIAARPGMGKTSLALNMARNFGYNGDAGLIFSLEMTNRQLMRRMIADIGSVDGSYLFQGELNQNTDKDVWNNINGASSKISELPIEFDDSVPTTIEKIYSRAAKAKALRGIKWIIVDHLSLISGWNKEGQGPKAEITGMLKVLAKELKITVIALSQLNREIEKRATRAPKMSDLRDAGTIEQDCDIALFPDVPEKSQNGTAGDEFEPAEFYVVKTRRGRTGKITNIKWQGHYYRFSDNF